MPPPDRFVFDLHQPYPDVVTETIRQSVVQAIADLANASTGVGDAYFLTDLIFDLIDQLFAASAAGDSERQQLRADLDALTARVAALEPPEAAP